MRTTTEHPNYREDYYNEYIKMYVENKKNMAENLRGTIQRVNERQHNGRNGVVTYHSFKVNDNWYSTGTKRPPSEGTLIEFAAEQNQKGFWDVTKAGIKVISAGTVTANVGSVAVAGATNSPMSKDDYWRRKEERDLAKEADFAKRDETIQLQSCRNSAIELVKILVDQKDNGEAVLKLPAAAKRVAFIENLVNDYTLKFVEQNKKNNKNEESESGPVSEANPNGPLDPADDAAWAA